MLELYCMSAILLGNSLSFWVKIQRVIYIRTRGLIGTCGSLISMELPKSVSLAWPLAAIKILVALTSACITPESWQNWSALAMSLQIQTRSSFNSADSCNLSCNDVPHSSIVINDKLLPCSILNIFTMLVCRSTVACLSEFIISLSFCLRGIILAATWSPEKCNK